jgi:hypothetical protein
MAYGTQTANIMDVPMSVSSVVAPYLGDNGYKFEGLNTVRVLSIANGTLADYNEASATAPFGGSPTLVAPNEQLLTLAYNKSMWLRIQQTQIQDIPVSSFTKQVALQQANEVFVPTHDAYSIAKVYAARPVGNKVLFNAVAGNTDLVLQFSRMIRKITSQGGNLNSVFAWVDMDIAAQINKLINFTGSDAGYGDGKKGYLGTLAGAKVVEVPTSYLAGVYAIAVDKHAVVNVTPKMDPTAGGMTVIEKVPGFGGVEIQLRDRGDTFVLNQKTRLVASLEAA